MSLPLNILFLITFIPAVGGILLLLLPVRRTQAMRWSALGISLIPLGLTIWAWFAFDHTSTAAFQFERQVTWFEAIHSSLHFGIDGISLVMVLLTTLLTPLAILTAFNIKEHVKAFMILFLLLETGMLGVFVSLDLLIFFVFWEIGLVPMYFLISHWGGEKRNYASLKFILFTMGGSLGLLLGLQLLGALTGTFDLVTLLQVWPGINEGVIFGIPNHIVRSIIFWAFVIAFAIKVPVWPFHTWLPDAHTEAPTAGSMILAGVLLKLGAYGFLRLVLPLFPQEAHTFAIWLGVLAVAAIVFGAFSASAQKDFKRLVAYSSINHMGFVVLAIAAAAYVGGSPDPALQQSATIAVTGAVLQMFNHGLTAAGMFFLVGVLYDRSHTRILDNFGGLYAILPVYGSILLLISMASLGLPGLNGFVSEFMIVRGTWPIFMAFTAISMLGLLFTGVYVLKALKLVLHGPLNEQWAGKLTDMNLREILVISPLIVLILAIGLWPSWLMEVINRAVMNWL